MRTTAIAIAVLAVVWLLFGCASTSPVDSGAAVPAIGEAEDAIDVDGDEPLGDGHVSDPAPGADPDPQPGPVEVLHALVNEARASPRTCGAYGPFEPAQPLALEVRLTAAAQRHSDDMHVSGFMGHTGSDGSSVSQRVEREGYAWSALGENVAWGYGSPEAVMSTWLSSPGHCANIMQPGFTESGLALTGTHWTQVFAHPR